MEIGFLFGGHSFSMGYFFSYSCFSLVYFMFVYFSMPSHVFSLCKNMLESV